MASNHDQVRVLGQRGITYNLSDGTRFENYSRGRSDKLLELIRFLLRQPAEHHW